MEIGVLQDLKSEGLLSVGCDKPYNSLPRYVQLYLLTSRLAKTNIYQHCH